MLYSASLYLLSLFYLLAGTNHFLVPDFYARMVPPYLPAPHFLVYLSGALEILMGILVLFRKSRRYASLGIILLLISFVPVHIYLIQTRGEPIGISLLFAWIRVPVQGLFICWAWYHYRNPGNPS
jgi:uncharacterized membrane protein